LLDLPGRGGFAGAQPHDHLADPDRLARPERELTRRAGALVEQPEHGDALGHRRCAGREPGHRLGHIDGLILDLGRIAPALVVRPARRAGGEEDRRRQPRL